MKIEKFLENRKGTWHDWNISYADGKRLYNLILENKYTQAIEIGTSTGLSAIWVAWALMQTGGSLLTVEVDKQRHQAARDNFKATGLSAYIDARLADAHDIVEKLEGPIDFVFADADKDWYINYFRALAPKLQTGGCFTAHNVMDDWMPGIQEFRHYIARVPDFKTIIDSTSKAGISISYKLAEK